MKELNEMEAPFVFGGQADFSDVSSSITSTEEIVGQSSTGDYVKLYLCAVTGQCLY